MCGVHSLLDFVVAGLPARPIRVITPPALRYTPALDEQSEALPHPYPRLSYGLIFVAAICSVPMAVRVLVL